jgi:acetolactate synthase small subunit
VAEQRWVFVVRVQDKPGALTSTASVFSNRGVSLEGVLGSGIAATTEEDGRLVFSFRATERKKIMLQRALERLSKVLGVESYAYDDPQLRAIAVARLTTQDGVKLDGADLQVDTIASQPEEVTLLLTGNAERLTHTLEDLRQRDVLKDVVVAAIAI